MGDLMLISIEKKAIVLRLRKDSQHMPPIMHFIKNSFKNVKYFSNVIIVNEDDNELARKKYLLKWVYKNTSNNDTINFKALNENLSLPIYIIYSTNKQVEKTLRITVDHINTHNQLRIGCSEYNPVIINNFKRLFKNSIVFGVDKKVFQVTIENKHDLSILKSLLSRKKISGIPIVFIVHKINLLKLYNQEYISEEQAYKKKLQKSYKVLGITDGFTKKELKNNYKKMLRKYHPDRVSSHGYEAINLYTQRFQVIQEAYSFIQEHLLYEYSYKQTA